ncbi:MAG: AEC family transporter [Burkholderiales bacterium]
MHAILVVTLPFFALVLCGHLAARQRLLPEAAIPGLNTYVLYFALPCMLFRFGASMPFAMLIDPTLIGVYALCALLIVALTVALTRRRVGLTSAAFGALVAAFPNSGFMGVPLLVALHADAAAGPVIGTLLVDLFLTSTLCLALAHVAPHDPAEGSTLASVGRSLRAALANPQPSAIALGALSPAMSVRLPAAVDQFVRMLADSASPVALFTIGAVRWRAGRHARTRTPLRDYLPVALIKLVVQPLLVGGVGLAARAAGLPVSSFGLMVLVLAAALPSASNVSLLAERFGADNGRVARIIMASTTLAFVSFTLIAWLLRT